MNRRSFAKHAVAATTAGALTAYPLTASAHMGHDHSQTGGKPFNLHYAPSFGKAKHHVGDRFEDQLQFMYDQGFRDWEDNRMMRRDVADQKRIAKKMEQLGMRMGVFVLYADFQNPTFAGNRMADQRPSQRDKEGMKDMLRKQTLEGVEVAKRVNAKWMTVVPGTEDRSLDREYQFLNVVEHLKYMSEILEPHGLVMVLEPLNFINHPGCFLERVQDAYAVCKAVNSPSCKILNDLYHQQISVGNLIRNMEACWDETAYIQVGDNPGRKEPTTGEINYKNIFRRLYELEFDGIVGMEHGTQGQGKAGEARLIQAYREVDAFL